MDRGQAHLLYFVRDRPLFAGVVVQPLQFSTRRAGVSKAAMFSSSQPHQAHWRIKIRILFLVCRCFCLPGVLTSLDAHGRTAPQGEIARC